MKVDYLLDNKEKKIYIVFDYGCSFVAKLSVEKKKFLFFTKYTLFAEKNLFIWKKSFAVKNVFPEKNFFYRKKYK